MYIYTDTVWDTVAIGSIADLDTCAETWMETSWFLMKQTDRQSNQAHRQRDRLAHNSPVISSNRSDTSQKTDTQTMQHAAISSIAVRRNTAWDALDPKNVYLNTMYFRICHTMCNLVAKWLKPTLYGADCDTDRQTDGQTDAIKMV